MPADRYSGGRRNVSASDLLDRLAERLLQDLPGPDETGRAPTIPELGRQYKLDPHQTDTTLRRALEGLRRQGAVDKFEVAGQQARQWRLTGRAVPAGQRPGRPAQHTDGGH